MSVALQRLLQHLQSASACLVSVESTQGSAPRERGAWMAVLGGEVAVLGTIGGGHLELEAIQLARNLLAASGEEEEGFVRRWALGPSLGQCCGGVVHLRFELVNALHRDGLRERLLPGLHPLALFGGGHVGHALVNVLGTLPFAIRWIDSRDSVFPADVLPQVECEHSDPVEAAVHHLPARARVLIMSFSHAEDLNIVAACLKRQRERGDLPFVGLIGSATKRAVFTSRLRQRGFEENEIAHITCPIGVPGITGKEPEVIAVAVAAQLLQSVYLDSSKSSVI
ncbi:xanthine dehydrogenase accessory protein XdhC [Diaphorobacter sp. HDW4A]|uniref:xanthine dehydrogenase accessory protein XdhC n=1 Tax=Diaphorobacter sp. HDW4A TaxID=2714924 RepID=UPI001F0E44EE|nr:xanthine dehydrogenase accessory protein XdhC [Diaphorobacter sp. HDW4A]